MHRPCRLLAMTVFAGTMLAGCSTNDANTSASALTSAVEPSTASSTAPRNVSSTTLIAPTTTELAPPTSSVDPNADVLAAARAFWDLFIAVGGTAGPFDPVAVKAKLAERTTGQELAALFQFFQGNAAAGYIVQGTVDLAPKVISNDGKTAQVRDCYDDRTGVYRLADGARIDTDNPARHQTLMTLIREDGVWKVSAVSDEGDGCVVGSSAGSSGWACSSAWPIGLGRMRAQPQ